MGGCVFIVVVAGVMIFSVKLNGVPLKPDVAVPIRERDQIAALTGGIVTLCFTIAHIFRDHSKKDEDGEEEELERLAGDVN